MGRKLRPWLAAAIAGFITAVSLLPSRWKVALGFASHSYFVDLVPHPSLAKLFGPVVEVNPHGASHVAAYLSAALVLLIPVRATRHRIAVAGLLGLLAGLTELAEHTMYKADFEWNDFRLDLYSILAGLAIAIAWRAFYTARREEPVTLLEQPAQSES